MNQHYKGTKTMNLKNDLVTFLAENEIQETITELALTIEKDYAGKELHIVCPLKGSVILTSDLVRKISLPTVVEFVHLTSPKNKSVVIHKDIQGDITCLLYTSPSPRDLSTSRMPSSA